MNIKVFKLKIFLFVHKIFKLLKIDFAENIFYIGNADLLPPPLSAEEEAYLIDHFYDEGANVKNILIERNLRLVVYIARKFETTGINVEDLISIGSIGLIKAINTFIPDKNIKLATYASRCIENEILMHLRRTNKQKAEVSIDEPLNVDWDGNELMLSDILGSDEDIIYREMDEEVDRQMLNDAISKLSMRERRIMSLRFGLSGEKEFTQKEVADMMGISQSYISRLEKRIISRLKNEMTKFG
ncbi:MAG: RNA polymerase sporulation sigma factor SigE [Clostridia bacterium]|nr:RNA polymerase sporulation sigma factor SigE [Clostridia bacterium]